MSKMLRVMGQVGRGRGDGLGSALADIGDGAMNSGLGVHYRTSPVNYRHGRATSGPVAGDRAPNAGGLEGVAFSGDLFDLMGGPHWSLVVHEYTDPVVLDNAEPRHLRVHRIGWAPGSGLVDAKGEFRRVYRPHPGELILIRPDGYIAARTSVGQGREADLIDHLAPFWPIGNPARPR
ncbi:hypothetical protein [Streptomyces sp. NPDC020480]|uniref:hypothetical protein n=1 Tax=Streptomyces sp. NPDC020480 TaxID=3365076 RepID=UPI0037A7B82A